MANMVEEGDTPLLPPARLEQLGYKIVAYPLTLLSCAALAMRDALESLARGEVPDARLDFGELRELVGFPAYDSEQQRYASDD
jgi:2-methylisocitrate lyase-like PEP mutase family enzyme